MMTGQIQQVMPILRMATENKQMFKLNDSVQMDGTIGRIIAIGRTSTLHVLVRVNDHTWKVEKWYSLMCQPYMSYMWTIENAFRIPERRYVKTPKLNAREADEYPYVLRLR
jgi:hypothetical protein